MAKKKKQKKTQKRGKRAVKLLAQITERIQNDELPRNGLQLSCRATPEHMRAIRLIKHVYGFSNQSEIVHQALIAYLLLINWNEEDHFRRS